MITPLSQRDPRWSGLQLGNDPTVLVGPEGCFFITLFMLCLRDRPASADLAKSFMACLVDHKNFAAGSARLASADISQCVPIEWGSVKLIYSSPKWRPDPTTGLKPDCPADQIQRLTTHLKGGGKAWIEVDSNLAQSGQQMHFLLATGYDTARGITVNDPWPLPPLAEDFLLPHYGSTLAKAIHGFALYNVIPTDPGIEEPPVGGTMTKYKVKRSTRMLIKAMDLPPGEAVLTGLPDPETPSLAKVGFTHGDLDLSGYVPIADLEVVPGDPPPPITYANPNLRITPNPIAQGGTITVSWSIQNIAGIWLNGLPEAGVMSRSFVASATKTYSLKVKYNDGKEITYTAVSTVTPAPPPPAQTTPRRGIGGNFLHVRQRAVDAIANLNFRDVLLIDDHDGCSWAADLLKKTGPFDGLGTVIFRKYINFWPQSPQHLFDIICGGNKDPRVLRVGTNETEFFPLGNSAQGVYEHALLDVATAKLCAQAGGIHYLLGTFATGNPDITNWKIAEALYRGYAKWWNVDAKLAGVKPVWDQHRYSPDPQHIYDTWEGDIDFAVPYMPANPSASNIDTTFAAPRTTRAISLNAYHTSTTEIVGERGIEVTRFANSSVLTTHDESLIAPSGYRRVHVYSSDWHETRPTFLFSLAGFDLTAGVLVSSEAGVDRGGFGGFVGCGMTAAEVVRWMRRDREILLRPVTDWYGHKQPMPQDGSVIFQGGNEDNNQGSWGSYSFWGYRGEIAPVLLEK